MRIHWMKIIAALAAALPLCATADGALYVQSLKAKLLAEPDFRAAVVVEAARGDALALVEARERWYKVQLGDKTGWVSRLVVSPSAPLSRSTTLDAYTDKVEINARRRASMATTAGAARGLTYDQRMRASHAGVADYAALEKMEKVQVSEEAALNFLAEGMKQ